MREGQASPHFDYEVTRELLDARCSASVSFLLPSPSLAAFKTDDTRGKREELILLTFYSEWLAVTPLCVSLAAVCQ